MSATTDIHELFGVSGLVALITGGGSGLGLYAARALEANGATVYIVGRREETLKKAASTAKHGNIKYIVGDVTSKDSLLAVASQVRSEVGYINFLFANAGVGGPKHTANSPKGGKVSVKDFQATCFEPAMEDFTKALHVNTSAVFYTVVAFLDLLAAGNDKRNVPQDSQVLVTSSVAGFSRQLASSFAYSASKAAVTHVTKMFSTLFARRGYHIRANVIAPGLYPSEMTERMTADMDDHQGGKAFMGAKKMGTDASPAERTGSEEEFGATVLFMASRAGAYLNGETLLTDGGRLAQLPAVY